MLARLDRLEGKRIMSRAVELRLRKLETERRSSTAPTSHVHLLGGTPEECEAQFQAMIADGNAAEDDMCIFMIPGVFPKWMDAANVPNHDQPDD